jgi:proteasome lid subunit RPN8/RPN11
VSIHPDILVPAAILRDIEEHALNPSPNRPGREVVGRLIVDKDTWRAVRYERLRNWARGDSRFMTRHGECDAPSEAGTFVVLVHSHPGSLRTPSKSDLKGASSTWLDIPYAIFHNVTRSLCFFRLHRDRKGFELLSGPFTASAFGFGREVEEES